MLYSSKKMPCIWEEILFVSLSCVYQALICISGEPLIMPATFEKLFCYFYRFLVHSHPYTHTRKIRPINFIMHMIKCFVRFIYLFAQNYIYGRKDNRYPILYVPILGIYIFFTRLVPHWQAASFVDSKFENW